MSLNLERHAAVKAYQIFAYQETSQSPKTEMWKRIGREDVAALPLPMACTLSQFKNGLKYHFAVRPVDQYGRLGVFSDPKTILHT